MSRSAAISEIEDELVRLEREYRNNRETLLKAKALLSGGVGVKVGHVESQTEVFQLQVVDHKGKTPSLKEIALRFAKGCKSDFTKFEVADFASQLYPDLEVDSSSWANVLGKLSREKDSGIILVMRGRGGAPSTFRFSSEHCSKTNND